MDPVTSTSCDSNIGVVAHEELAHVAGGMIDSYEGMGHPGAHTPGQLMSVIGYRTFGDVGL